MNSFKKRYNKNFNSNIETFEDCPPAPAPCPNFEMESTRHRNCPPAPAPCPLL